MGLEIADGFDSIGELHGGLIPNSDLNIDHI
jgi:hypothetical protein